MLGDRAWPDNVAVAVAVGVAVGVGMVNVLAAGFVVPDREKYSRRMRPTPPLPPKQLEQPAPPLPPGPPTAVTSELPTVCWSATTLIDPPAPPPPGRSQAFGPGSPLALSAPATVTERA